VATPDPFGVDLYGVDDLTPTMRTVSGPLGLTQAITRRLITPSGALWYDPAYGWDVRRYLSASIANVGQIAASCAHEAEKDERVASATATATFTTKTLAIAMHIVSAFGPFTFTITIDKVTAELLLQAPT
jgi:hypothetical protein